MYILFFYFLVLAGFGFLGLGFWKKGPAFFALAGITLLGTGLLVLSEGLTEDKGARIIGEPPDIQIIDANVTYDPAEIPALNIFANLLFYGGIVLVMLSFAGLVYVAKW